MPYQETSPIITYYRKLPLVQGGLKIGCQVTARMPTTVKNHILIDKHLELVKESYTEPKEEIIFGSFLSRVDKSGVDFSTEKADKDIRAQVGRKGKVQERKSLEKFA